MSAEDSRAVAQRWMQEVWQKGDAAAMDELLAADFVFNYPSPGARGDREGYKATVKEILGGFPDVKFSAQDVVAEGDRVVVHWRGRGTHRGDYWGIAPTGRQVTMEGLSLLRIAGGKLAAEVGYSNTLEMMQELGAFPASG
jgi:steroid delta-isomerase-like uncharacterized protein